MGQSDSLLDEHWPFVSRLLSRVLHDDGPATAYSQYLAQYLDAWAKRDTQAYSFGTLPVLTCQANGGEPNQAVPVMMAWQLLRLAAKLLDDIVDGEASGSPAQVINVATSLLFLAQLVLGKLTELGVSSEHVSRLYQALGHTGLHSCAAQHAEMETWRVLIPYPDPDLWLQIALAKSGEPFAWAAWAGALIAGADERALSCYREYGSHLGVLLQAADDFNGVWRSTGVSDLASRRIALPVCYALWVAKTEEQQRLKALLERATQGDIEAEVEAQRALTKAGAQDYVLVVARVQYQCATEALQNANCPPLTRQPLIALLDRVMPMLNRSEG